MYMPRVVFTFDDAHSNIYTNAYPIMDTAGIDGTLFVPSDYVGNVEKLTYPQLLEMQNNGWEVACHSKSHPANMTTLSEADARVQLQAKSILESEGLTVNTFGPPGRLWNNDLATWAEEEGYKCVRAVSDIGYLTQYYPIIPNLFYVDLGSPSVNSELITSDVVQFWIDQAIRRESLLILLFHEIANDAGNLYATNLTDFNAIVDYAVARQNEGKLEITNFYDAMSKQFRAII